MQRCKAIDEFLNSLSKDELQSYAKKDFKVRIGANYGIGNGEMATFTFVDGWTDYTWNVTFKRGDKIFRVHWYNDKPVINWFEKD